jgi:hypothetical protein
VNTSEYSTGGMVTDERKEENLFHASFSTTNPTDCPGIHKKKLALAA